jgi:4-amino-4-deoxy-L-arabinose transferase-like glycosyltransferase
MIAAPHLDPPTAQHSSSPRRQVILETTFVVALVAVAFALRLWPLSKAHFWDEAVYLQNAEVICCAKVNYSELDSRPPLLSLIFAAVFLLWHHVYAASIATALLNALGPALLYVSGRLIAGWVPAGIAALLLACSPFFVGVFPTGFESTDTGNSLLSDSPALTLILVSFWLLLRAMRRQTDLRFAGAGFVLGLAVLMRFASLSSAGVLSLLVLGAKQWRRAAGACAVGFAAGIGPYLCWSRFRYGGFFRTLQNGWANFQGPAEPAFFYVKNLGTILGWITLAGLALWIGRWVWETWKREGGDHPVTAVEPTGGRHSRGLDAFLWFWAASLLVFYSALRHSEPRYVIPVAPPLFLLAGSGLSWLLRGRAAAARVAGTILLGGALSYTFWPVHERFESPFIDDEPSEEMQVADFLTHSVPPTTVLYSNFNYPVFAYYTSLRVSRLPPSGPPLYDALSRLPSDGILIAYKADDVIPSLPGWVESSPHFRRFREFPSIVLYTYRHIGGDQR